MKDTWNYCMKHANIQQQQATTDSNNNKSRDKGQKQGKAVPHEISNLRVETVWVGSIGFEKLITTVTIATPGLNSFLLLLLLLLLAWCRLNGNPVIQPSSLPAWLSVLLYDSMSIEFIRLLQCAAKLKNNCRHILCFFQREICSVLLENNRFSWQNLEHKKLSQISKTNLQSEYNPRMPSFFGRDTKIYSVNRIFFFFRFEIINKFKCWMLLLSFHLQHTSLRIERIKMLQMSSRIHPEYISLTIYAIIEDW